MALMWCVFGFGVFAGCSFLDFLGWSGLGFVFVALRLCCGVCVCWICGFLGVLWVVCLVSLVFLALFTFGVGFALGLVVCGVIWLVLVFLADVCGFVVRFVVCVGLLCIACGFAWLVVIAGILTHLVRFGVVVISGVFEFAFMLLAWRMLCGVLLVVLLVGVCVLVVAGLWFVFWLMCLICLVCGLCILVRFGDLFVVGYCLGVLWLFIVCDFGFVWFMVLGCCFQFDVPGVDLLMCWWFDFG